MSKEGQISPIEPQSQQSVIHSCLRLLFRVQVSLSCTTVEAKVRPSYGRNHVIFEFATRGVSILCMLIAATFLLPACSNCVFMCIFKLVNRSQVIQRWTAVVDQR